MKQVLHDLVEKSYIQRHQIVWIDGNEIDPLQFDLGHVLESYLSLFPGETPFLVIDEVHEIPDRVRQVFYIYNK